MNIRAQIKSIPAVVSVDSYKGKIVTGRFWQAGENTETSFISLMQLIGLIGELVEKTQGSGTDERCKCFVRPESAEPEKEVLCAAEPTRGALATFRLHVLFHQNMSWQGLVTWLEGQQEESFRSFLELVMLLDSVLCFAEENENH